MSSENSTITPELVPHSPVLSVAGSSSTIITAGTTTPREEDLYRAAAAMSSDRQRAMQSASSSSTATTAVSSVATGHTVETDLTARDSGSSGGGSGTFAFDSDMSKYPPSMTSSVRAHVYEGGLRYHAFRDGQYAFPNDEIEQSRDDMKHTMTLMVTRGEYFYAPVGKALEAGGVVLDLGTGTGIWAIELGDKYPKAHITGIDLSPIQPNFVPENVHFFVDDFEEEWVDPENKYDFIHCRHTAHSIKNSKLLLQRVLRHLKPGGFFEIADLYFVPQCDDETMTPDTPYALRDFMNYINAGMRVLGSDLRGIISATDEMKAAGFENVETIQHKIPIGLWPRDKRLRLAGLFLRTAMMDGLRGISRRPLLALGWTQLQIEMFLVDVRKAIMDAKFHTYLTYYAVHGRKPLS